MVLARIRTLENNNAPAAEIDAANDAYWQAVDRERAEVAEYVHKTHAELARTANRKRGSHT
jgi:hypothetical protein